MPQELLDVDRVPAHLHAGWHRDMKGEQEQSAGDEHAVELRERASQLVVIEVLDRVQSHDPAPGLVVRIQPQHGAHLEHHLGRALPGHGDHALREVDPSSAPTELVQVAGDMARPAADIGDR